MQRLADLAVGEQLELLGQQVAVVVPLEARRIEVLLLAIGELVVVAVDQGGDGERAQLVVPELVAGAGTDGTLLRQVLDHVALVGDLALPEPVVVDEAVQRVLAGIIVGADLAVLLLAVVLALHVVTPESVAGVGLEIDVVVGHIVLGLLAVQREIDVAVPYPVLEDRLGRHHLLDAGQLHGLRLAVDQGHLARPGGLDALGVLASLGILLDQQVLLALEGGDLVPLERDVAAIVGLQQQLAAVEQGDLAGKAVTVLHPDRIGKGRGGTCKGSEAQQDSRQHEHKSTELGSKRPALSKCRAAEQGPGHGR